MAGGGPAPVGGIQPGDPVAVGKAAVQQVLQLLQAAADCGWIKVGGADIAQLQSGGVGVAPEPSNLPSTQRAVSIVVKRQWPVGLHDGAVLFV